MDADTQRLLESVVGRPFFWSTQSNRDQLNRIVSLALVSECRMEDLLTALDHIDKDVDSPSWLSKIWIFNKAARFGIRSLTLSQLRACLSNKVVLLSLQAFIRDSFARGISHPSWWKLRVESANMFLEKSGLSESHEDAARRYEMQLKENRNLIDIVDLSQNI